MSRSLQDAAMPELVQSGGDNYRPRRRRARTGTRICPAATTAPEVPLAVNASAPVSDAAMEPDTGGFAVPLEEKVSAPVSLAAIVPAGWTVPLAAAVSEPDSVAARVPDALPEVMPSSMMDESNGPAIAGSNHPSGRPSLSKTMMSATLVQRHSQVRRGRDRGYGHQRTRGRRYASERTAAGRGQNMSLAHV